MPLQPTTATHGMSCQGFLKASCSGMEYTYTRSLEGWGSQAEDGERGREEGGGGSGVLGNARAGHAAVWRCCV